MKCLYFLSENGFRLFNILLIHSGKSFISTTELLSDNVEVVFKSHMTSVVFHEKQAGSVV